MTTNNVNNLTDFLNKFKTAKSYNSKEMRLTIHEAEQLTIGIAELMARQTELADKVIELQNQIMNNVEVVQDGGKF
jgi:hypothetical protein